VSLIDIHRGVGTPPRAGQCGVSGGPAARTAGPPPNLAREKPPFAGIAYRNPAPPHYQLADIHVMRIGPDGTVWVDGHPDDGRPLRPRCPVRSCLQEQTDYPGHLCLQPDGSETWRDWP
jgi:hypothetical protein